jgi:pimeloyl-ACP methyl ester carboxylesterase
MVKRILCLTVIVLGVQLSLLGSAQSATQSPPQIKELNFVFLHGAGGDSGDLQLLADAIEAQAPPYIRDYEETHYGTKVRVDTLARCYPNNVDISTWANNIATSIDEHFQKSNLILIGHSMGGKTALYTIAHNVGDLANKVPLVVTINSPINTLSKYYFIGGADYWRARWLISSDQGMLDSLAYYDSTQDGSWVGSHKHWLAFISGESAPLSNQFDVSGVDPLPRDMDDTIVPISAQYSEGADVIYYGEFGHSDFSTIDNVATYIAQQILRYIFGGNIEFSVFARSGIFEHKAGWLPVTNSWEDVVGELPAMDGTLIHQNKSFFKWQEWEDVVGAYTPDSQRSSYQASLVNSFPLLTGLSESRWLTADSPEDYRLYLRTRAAPRISVQVHWSVNSNVIMPAGTERDRYEIETVTGTPFTEINEATWFINDQCDLRMQIRSKAAGPLRWFKAKWRTYAKEIIERKIIDEIPGEVLSGDIMGTQ